MAKKIVGGANRQAEWFPRSRRPTIGIEENHRLVQLTDRLDWTEMEVHAESIRASGVETPTERCPS